MFKGVPLKPDRFLIYITGALSDIFKLFYLFLCKVHVSISNFSSEQHRQKKACRQLLANAQITDTCSRYLGILFTSSIVDLYMCAGQLSRQTSLDLHYCTCTQVASYPEIPDIRPKSWFSQSTKFREWGQKRTCMERVKICKWIPRFSWKKWFLLH